jgi:hypothetical protein
VRAGHGYDAGLAGRSGIVPTALWVNLSTAIAALIERGSERYLKRRGQGE